ncbi:EDD domain protein, DegV family [Dethiosulfatibacter aminovorans DSM 17477]|uniref:EDD domain protein, DegV family n=1 Tax=Dethiosulfatibacter aminovorans DSM 17477 TaxID=1121476 RepID=A0A1M6EF04_9FIRM|nr:DegV family protein [Dethiosulfatibacter aminovorans]SHI84066.1 EDD domain protein, DegV family [Dethiosulfatibacter aminovorans DSM 17477]
MAIRIVTDSTSDMPKEIAKKYNIKIAPLRVNFGEESFLDGVELTNEEFYKKLATAKELPTTSQVNPGEFVDIFNEILDEGDEVIGIFISSDLSGTYSSAKIAQDMIKSDKIHILDSRGVTAMTTLMSIEAAKMAEKGKSAAEIMELLKKMVENMKTMFIIDTLEYLVKGGRLSAVQGAIGGLLNVKPIIQVNGVVETVTKVRGRAKGIKYIMDWLYSSQFDLSNKTVFIVNSNDQAFGDKIKTVLLENFKVGEILEAPIGAVVGTHAGPGCAGLLFCDMDIQ